MENRKLNGEKLISRVYVARQPILDRQERLFAYELLFRTGFDNYYDHIDGDYATSQTIMNSFMTLGMDSLTGGKMAFINFTRNLLLKEVAAIFPKKLLGVEVLETIKPDEEVIDAIKKLRRAGYLIILDDFILKPGYDRLIDLSDIIKIDFKISNQRERETVLSSVNNPRIRFLAEKVETKQEFALAKDMGFSYFQGYFFSKPVIISRKDIPGYKLIYLQVLQAVNDPGVEFEQLEHIVKRDVSLTYKLLRFINSAAFGFHTRIQSIRQALTLLGMKEFKKWVSLIALNGMGDDKPEELVVSTMIRARFCELIAGPINRKNETSDLFLMGMFSLLDAFVDRPMEEIMAELPIAAPIKAAILGDENPYTDVLRLVISYESARWEEAQEYVNRLGLDEARCPDIYLSSLEWASRIFKG